MDWVCSDLHDSSSDIEWSIFPSSMWFVTVVTVVVGIGVAFFKLWCFFV
jgi:hypothetical protein